MSGDERFVYEAPSRFGQLTVTESEEGRRSLWFGRGRVCQGVVELGRVGCSGLPYAAVALATLTALPSLDRILIVGLGAGVIPRFVHAYWPDTRIEVVEIDPVVVDVAERFFEFEQDERLRVHVADGRSFISSCTACFDAILLDGYGLHDVPSHLSTHEFLASACAVLRRGGAVVANVWGDSSHRHHACTLATYREAFAEVHVLDVATLANKIVLALPEPIELTRERLVAAARAYSAAHRLPLELGDHVHGMRSVDELELDGRVLRDSEA
jgi:spermidine synthase